jgi:hypothetical protein
MLCPAYLLPVITLCCIPPYKNITLAIIVTSQEVINHNVQATGILLILRSGVQKQLTCNFFIFYFL